MNMWMKLTWPMDRSSKVLVGAFIAYIAFVTLLLLLSPSWELFSTVFPAVAFTVVAWRMLFISGLVRKTEGFRWVGMKVADALMHCDEVTITRYGDGLVVTPKEAP